MEISIVELFTPIILIWGLVVGYLLICIYTLKKGILEEFRARIDEPWKKAFEKLRRDNDNRRA